MERALGAGEPPQSWLFECGFLAAAGRLTSVAGIRQRRCGLGYMSRGGYYRRNIMGFTGRIEPETHPLSKGRPSDLPSDHRPFKREAAFPGRIHSPSLRWPRQTWEGTVSCLRAKEGREADIWGQTG